MGYIDLLAEIAGGGYEDLLPHAVRLDVFGVSCLCLDLDTLIRTKRAAGRPKDYEALAEIEIIREERDKRSGPKRDPALAQVGHARRRAGRATPRSTFPGLRRRIEPSDARGRDVK